MEAKEENVNEVKDVAEAPKKAVAVPTSFISKLFAKIKEEFLEVNAGMDLDFVYLGSWLVVNGKGQFVDSDDESINYGDEIEVVVAQGNQKFMVWGKEKTPEANTVLVAEDTKEKAVEMLNSLLEARPELEGYDEDSIQSKYLAYIIPVESLKEEVPKVYLLSMPSTAKIKYGKYAFDRLFKGGYKAIGIPAKTAVSKVITKIVTKEQKNNDNQKYTTFEFDAVGMFKPEDFGITE